MKIEGAKVIHKTFGEGVVVSLKEKEIVCAFKDRESRLLISKVFNDKLLKFADENLQQEFEKSIKQENESAQKPYNDTKYPFEPNIVFASDSPVRPVRDSAPLTCGSYYGTNASDIYVSCCRAFCWDISQKHKFGMKRPLFAEKVTPEKYDVWFLAHSNYISEKPDNPWRNTFSKDGEMICEEWTDQTRYMDPADTLRVVFAKTQYGKYMFAGVYEIADKIKNKRGNLLRIFKRTSKVYPD